MPHSNPGFPDKIPFSCKTVKKRAIFAIPSISKGLSIKYIRRGSKISRAFRYIFESKKLRTFLGANLAAASIIISFFPNNSNLFSDDSLDSITQPPIVFITQKSQIRNPVDNMKITQEYKFYHPGIDLDTKTGNPVYPIMDGKVEAIQHSNIGYGNAILINHNSKITSLYAHLSKIFVKKDQEVSVESVIGNVGSTGRSSGDHLHLEIREDGIPLNPLDILSIP